MIRSLLLLTILFAYPFTVRAQKIDRRPPSADVLNPDQWKSVDETVDRGLAWLASQQLPDGSIPSMDTGQPAVTSLAVMAFLSRGHRPGAGPYGEVIDRGIDFVITQQRDATTLICRANYPVMEGLIGFLTEECCAEEKSCRSDAA